MIDGDDGKYARDDGSLVPFEECTRDELLSAIAQLRQAQRVQKRRIEQLMSSHDDTRRRAYKHVAGIVAALAS